MIISQIVLHQPIGVLRLRTDTGAEGHCTGVVTPVSDLDTVSSVLLNSNPLDRERLWCALKNVEGELAPNLCSGIDVALWDLSSKIAGRSVCAHVHNFRDSIPVCQIGTEGVETQEIVQEAREAQLAGFKAYRFHAAADEQSLICLIRAVREAVGPDFPLMFDGRTRCMVDEAIRIGRALDDEDYFCFNNPRPNNDHTGGRQVSCEIDTPTSAGVSNPMETAQVMTTQSADHVRTSVRCSGGFTDVLKSARCAEAFGAYCHLNGLGICDGFAHLHLVGASRNSPFFEMNRYKTISPFVQNPLQVHNGFAQVPDSPGLGIELDLDAVNEHTVTMIKT